MELHGMLRMLSTHLLFPRLCGELAWLDVRG